MEQALQLQDSEKFLQEHSAWSVVFLMHSTSMYLLQAA